jgi:vancomycin permeability regulator SanA
MRSPLRRKLAWTAGAVAAALLVAFAGIAASNAWVARAARGRAYASVDAVPSRSVAIVPGSRVVDGKPFLQLRDRLETALMLYRGGRVKQILVSGRNTIASSEATVMSNWLREHGVEPADIIVDEGGTRTRETMDRAAGIFDVTDAVICTQDVNAARSVYLAEAAGIDAVAVGLPTTLSRSPRYMRMEALKTALAYLESYFRTGPSSSRGVRTAQ